LSSIENIWADIPDKAPLGVGSGKSSLSQASLHAVGASQHPFDLQMLKQTERRYFVWHIRGGIQFVAV
jgi:hypothetical protein